VIRTLVIHQAGLSPYEFIVNGGEIHFHTN